VSRAAAPPRAPPPLPACPPGVHHVALICADLEASLKFYEGVLGEGLPRGSPGGFGGGERRARRRRARPPPRPRPGRCVGKCFQPLTRPHPATHPTVPGLEVSPDRPHDKLPYRGAWLWIGNEMIHLMELPAAGEGGEGAGAEGAAPAPPAPPAERSFRIGVPSLPGLVSRLEAARVPFTCAAAGGRAAVQFKDPDACEIECFELEA
jgi:catechol 2,3-dioxygenase-like lactoylglutathione lyase family enzyme